MKNLIVIFSLILLTTQLYGQDFSKLSLDDFKSADGCKKAESQVTECCNYLFGNPVNKEPETRLKVIQYVMKWMEATPDFMFDIDDTAMQLTEGNQDLLVLYLAAMAQSAIELGKDKLTKEALADKTVKKFLDYCNVAENGVKPTAEIKRRLREMNGVEV